MRPVAVPATRVTAARASSTSVSAGYVPDGLTAKQWEDMKKEKAAKAAARKKEVANKKFEVNQLGGIGTCRPLIYLLSRRSHFPLPLAKAGHL